MPDADQWQKVPTFLARCAACGWRMRALDVEAHESRVFEVYGDDGAPRAILKVYNSLLHLRCEADAALLRALHERGVRVPAVLDAFADEGAILLQWCGSRTLADLLKLDKAVDPSIWRQALGEAAGLHAALDSLRGRLADVPRWQFSLNDRIDWPREGLDAWASSRLIDTGRVARLAGSIEGLAQRLARPELEDAIIWGDCNPKNVLVGEDGQVCLIDFQPRRSSIMLDLVLLMAFADAPQTYVPRAQAHRWIELYWRQRSRALPALPEFLQWYDDELFWRILVYGGMLLRQREQRLQCWRDVCAKMVDDLVELA